ncbi:MULTISPECIES: NAD(P)-dependent oxidoreductase [unclassified Acinetobacter]|uniref:NAD(P)-dependent oxidoreductase n=1 Tax=unclassified Acinetobacter TaxID=196816 RepID=UPI002934650D|nr:MULTISPECIES: NAD(P)-dependent oxidoreductase [unclassified Acinetobacter]WOE31240.1 NAD(P)-dependent oxidoreductase [Acinetobacter sp. SAAs470]WOE39436.1 NAD(P)-dependent oxidoreductase [Acinetobacter sp. SAAs474]
MNVNQTTPIAFLGIGLMGSRMVKRLLQANFSVGVWNRTASACDELIQHGAHHIHFQQLDQYAIICLCLADDHAATEVFHQIEPFLHPNQVIIDFSSLSVETTLTLANQAKGKHVTWIDSPVSGGTIGAEQGSLVIFAGGDAQTIAQLDPLYRILSQRVTCMGDTGTGQATKICNQLIVAANSALIAEAVALAAQAGVNTQLLAPALAGGFADSKPFQILAPRMATHCFEPVQWKVQTLSKDLNLALTLAAQYQLTIPVAKAALAQLQQHQQQGFAQADLSSLIQQVEL